MKVSLFDGATDNHPKQLELTWDEFVASIGGHDYSQTTKATLPAFSPAEFAVGKTRQTKNVLRIWFGVLDLDQITPFQLLQVCQRLEGLDAFLYTTWSHAMKAAPAGLWSARVCVRFSRPIFPTEWSLVWPALMARFDAPADPKCKNVDRIYFGPFAPAGTAHLQEWHVWHGAPLDVSTLDLTARPTVQSSNEKISRERLAKLARRWKSSRDDYRANMGEILLKVANGEAFAEPGERDNTLYQLAKDISKVWPSADPMSLAAHFSQSLQLMGADGPSVDDVAAKFTRALEDITAEEANAALAELNEHKTRVREAFAPEDRDYDYTTSELAEFAETCKCTPEEMTKRWIIQRGTQFYLFVNGHYSPPYGPIDVMAAMLRDLAPAHAGGVDLYEHRDGTITRKTLAQMMSDYGTVATNYILDMRAQEASYDGAARLFVEAPCPLRPLEPTFDPKIDQWLKLMTGPHYAAVQNWMALATNLDLICCALLFTGPPGTGKTLFAVGMSRIWSTEQPTDLESALASFNDALSRCPLVFADEQLPKDFRGHGRTAEIRKLIADKSRPHKKKFAPETSILGAIRLVIAANNDDILSIPENLSANDVEAIGDRFYHVPVTGDSAIYLQRTNTESWVNGDGIAKHALWLRDHYPVTREGRFQIKSPDREFYHALTTRTGIRSAVCQWLVGYLKDPRAIDMREQWLVRIHGFRLLVNSQAIISTWDRYVPNEPVPPTGRLSQALGGLSLGKAHMRRPKGAAMHYFAINPDHLRAWANETNFATREEIDAALARSTESRLAENSGQPAIH